MPKKEDEIKKDEKNKIPPAAEDTNRKNDQNKPKRPEKDR